MIDAAAGPLFCHREPEHFTLQEEVRERLVRVMDLDPAVWPAVLIVGSGTLAMESMILAGVPAGKRLRVSDNGVYGTARSASQGRMSSTLRTTSASAEGEIDAPRAIRSTRPYPSAPGSR